MSHSARTIRLSILIFVFSGCGPQNEPQAIPVEVEMEHTQSIPFDSCGTQPCGTPCTLCRPNDGSCFETAIVKICNTAGECVAKTQSVLDNCPANTP